MKLRIAALGAAALALLAGAALAWNPGATPVAARAKKVQDKLAYAKSFPDALKAKLALADQAAPPTWLDKTVWTLEEGGQTWVLGVGAIRVKNPALAMQAAEARARAELSKHINGVTVEREETARGRSVRTKSVGEVRGAVILDLYRAKDGTTYALAAAPKPR